ncbi:MAG: tRNA lysidine(34) synthetase TilS [Tepidimonas sp.]|uniref:tRNA lysidine(34) synthetase TilS n=1 Tax=Tepidimonas sp. TaxID=2002775 RepID=UPI00259E653D|nr:tRNA lysidine(34) synthetase TilS [Tepidimonas sp.]MDM7457465.1 tRNA lysidine(34) synthetase TilS [Tepidimonas sp.]
MVPTADPAVLAALDAWWQRHAAALPSGAGLAVAFSGGADSTALLLAAAARWPGQVHALHVHHGLQAAADAFEAHAAATAARWGVPFAPLRVDARPAPGDSPEDAARRARYRALADAARARGLGVVLLGHHAQDQAETLLLALTRGAGLPGLAGMPERRCIHGVWFGRPLLALDGEALRRWLVGQGIAWVDDPTNTDPAYTRNRIRLQVIPALARAFPTYAATLARSARHAATAQRLLEELAADDLARLGDPPALAGLRALSPERAINALRHWLRQRHGASGTEAQWQEVARQIAAARTRGHAMRLRVGAGYLLRAGAVLDYRSDPCAPAGQGPGYAVPRPL